MAFSPAFNAALIGQIRASQDGQAVLMLGAIGIAMLLVLTTVGFRVDVVVRAVMRWLAREPRIPIVPDDGPSYLYTRVPRSLWVEAGRLGCVPTTPAGSR
jgi:hypothetical protein